MKELNVMFNIEVEDDAWMNDDKYPNEYYINEMISVIKSTKLRDLIKEV